MKKLLVQLLSFGLFAAVLCACSAGTNPSLPFSGERVVRIDVYRVAATGVQKKVITEEAAIEKIVALCSQQGTGEVKQAAGMRGKEATGIRFFLEDHSAYEMVCAEGCRECKVQTCRKLHSVAELWDWAAVPAVWANVSELPGLMRGSQL